LPLESLLEQSARQWPDKTALVCGPRRETYAALDAAANRLAHGLIAEGVAQGDRVAIYLDNSVETVVAIFAALKAGAAFCPINATTKPEKLVYLLNHSRATTLILSHRKLGAMDDSWELLPHLRRVIVVGASSSTDADCGKRCVSWASLVEEHTPDLPLPQRTTCDQDLAALIYTSGSTGTPKGVMLTHGNLLSATSSITSYLENRPGDVLLCVLPLSYSYGLSQIYTAFACGATVVLEKSFTYPHAILERLVREKVTGLPIVPTISAILLEMRLESYDLSSLRYITNAGAAWPAEHIAQFRGRLPHVRLFPMYGQTECVRISYLPPEEIDRRPSSIGRGMPGEQLWLVDEQGQRVGSGVVGELAVCGPHVTTGYWDLPDETDRRLRAGPRPGERTLLTGDLFRADEEGYLTFVGRKDDIIKSRGEKVSPREVEIVLCTHPDVAEAAVFGVPDPIFGQAIKAVVCLRAGHNISSPELRRHCAASLEDFMVPQSIEICRAIPKTENGKIDKRQLCGAKQ